MRNRILFFGPAVVIRFNGTNSAFLTMELAGRTAFMTFVGITGDLDGIFLHTALLTSAPSYPFAIGKDGNDL